jgi:hypothetical protein
MRVAPPIDLDSGLFRAKAIERQEKQQYLCIADSMG